MYKWIKNRWTDPVWSKVFANLIWLIITSICILFYTILKKVTLNLSFRDAWTKTLEFFSTKIEISTFWIIVFLLFVILLIINIDLLKRLLRRLYNRNVKKEDFIFQRQLKDDHFYPYPLLTPEIKYKLEIRPINSPYWRFGFTLSKTGLIDQFQRQQRLPLFHLTKNLDVNQLVATEYDDNFKIVTHDLLLIDNYVDQLVTIIIFYEKKTLSTFIRVIDSSNRELIKRSYQGFQYIIIAAWGDGHDYKINMIKTTYY